MDLQRAEIDFHRHVYGIRPVALHEIPKWWMERVCWATQGWGACDAVIGMQELDPCRFLYFDHWGTSDDRPDDRPWCGGTSSRVFVTEPYLDIHDERVWGWTQQVADTLGIEFRILPSDQSWWYPHYTIRIEFAPCLHDPLCKGCKTREQMRDESRRRKRRR